MVTSIKNKAVFLDRDVVLITAPKVQNKPTSVNQISGIEILNGVVEAINYFKENTYIPIVVTNQPDVARGIISKEMVIQSNNYIGEILGIEQFYSCFHDDKDECQCRKPKPGLLVQAARDHFIDLESSILVGDRWRDIKAGQAAKCQNFFIDYQYDEMQPLGSFEKVNSLLEVEKKMEESHGKRSH